MLSDYAQQGDSLVVTAVTAVSFALVQGDDVTEQCYRCSRSGPFALLATSAGIPFSPGALPVGRLSMALLSFSRLGVSSSSFCDRQALHSLHRGIPGGVLPAVQVRIMLHPPLHLLALACDGFTSSRFKWASLAVCWSDGLFDTIADTPGQNCQLHTLTELYPTVTGTSAGCALHLTPCCSKSL